MRDEYTRPSRLLNTSEGRDNSSLAVNVLNGRSITSTVNLTCSVAKTTEIKGTGLLVFHEETRRTVIKTNDCYTV